MKISNSVIIAVLLIFVMSATTEARPFYLLGATGVIPAIMLQVRVTFSKNLTFIFNKVLTLWRHFQGGTATTLSLAGAKTLGALALSGALNSEDIPQPSYGGSSPSFKSFKSRLSKRPIKVSLQNSWSSICIKASLGEEVLSVQIIAILQYCRKILHMQQQLLTDTKRSCILRITMVDDGRFKRLFAM